MRIKQEDNVYRPISFVMETEYEAEAMKSLANKICNCFAVTGYKIKSEDLTIEERGLAIAISDAFIDEVARL